MDPRGRRVVDWSLRVYIYEFEHSHNDNDNDKLYLSIYTVHITVKYNIYKTPLDKSQQIIMFTYIKVFVSEQVAERRPGRALRHITPFGAVIIRSFDVSKIGYSCV